MKQENQQILDPKTRDRKSTVDSVALLSRKPFRYGRHVGSMVILVFLNGCAQRHIAATVETGSENSGGRNTPDAEGQTNDTPAGEETGDGFESSQGPSGYESGEEHETFGDEDSSGVGEPMHPKEPLSPPEFLETETWTHSTFPGVLRHELEQNRRESGNWPVVVEDCRSKDWGETHLYFSIYWETKALIPPNGETRCDSDVRLRGRRSSQTVSQIWEEFGPDPSLPPPLVDVTDSAGHYIFIVEEVLTNDVCEENCGFDCSGPACEPAGR